MNSGFSDIYSWIEEGSEGKPTSHTFEYLNDQFLHTNQQIQQLQTQIVYRNYRTNAKTCSESL